MARVFFDTNVFVYARIDFHDAKSEQAVRAFAVDAEPVISTQILVEFANVALRRRLAHERVIEELVYLQDYAAALVATDMDVIEGAVVIARDAKISWFDSLIVSAAAEAGCGTLVTEDLSDGQVIAGVRVVNPFAAL